jgi:ABC-type antimicrobial peptide transport system permease subunit
LVASYGLKVAILGVAVGILGALAATRLIKGFLFGVQPWDPLTFAVVATFLLGIAMAACVLPALRATRIDPVRALRSE